MKTLLLLFTMLTVPLFLFTACQEDHAALPEREAANTVEATSSIEDTGMVTEPAQTPEAPLSDDTVSTQDETQPVTIDEEAMKILERPVAALLDVLWVGVDSGGFAVYTPEDAVSLDFQHSYLYLLAWLNNTSWEPKWQISYEEAALWLSLAFGDNADVEGIAKEVDVAGSDENRSAVTYENRVFYFEDSDGARYTARYTDTAAPEYREDREYAYQIEVNFEDGTLIGEALVTLGSVQSEYNPYGIFIKSIRVENIRFE